VRARPAGAWSAGRPRSVAACGAWAARGRRRRPLRRRKERFNPLSLEPPAAGGTFSQFRDPTTAWRENGLWYTVIGVQANCIGGAAMYSSPDLRAWTYVGQLATQLGINNTAGLLCAAPPTPQPGNGACDPDGPGLPHLGALHAPPPVRFGMEQQPPLGASLTGPGAGRA